jgi:galacturan 1,4-alpha-galacturonidase
MIPSGLYKMNAVVVKGPCKSAIEIQVDGTIQAPENPDELNDAYEWVKIQYVDFLTLSGKGVFDGNGEIAWKQNDCGKNSKCKRPSMVNKSNLYIFISNLHMSFQISNYQSKYFLIELICL